MTKAVQKITLSPSRDIPFNKLVLSQSNVRRVKVGISIEQHPRLYAYDDDRHRTGDQQGRPPARARARIDSTGAQRRSLHRRLPASAAGDVTFGLEPVVI